ncbi:MAG: hypothetical protein U9P49_10810 [Thermodesulfobacteriota bacterium]|nr:hypothetical protein [Thermodesulfobacteriota bacterium]
MSDTYKVKKSFRIPMVVSVIISLPIFADVILNEAQMPHLAIAIFLLLIFYILTINSLIRKVTLSEDGIRIRGLLGSRTSKLDDISFIDGVSIGSKQYITISVPKKTYIIPNSYAGFDKITNFFCSHLKEDKTGEGIRLIRENPVNRNKDTIVAWITAGVLVLVLFIRFHFLFLN